MKQKYVQFSINDKPYKVISIGFLITFLGLFLAWSSVKIWIKSEANQIAKEASLKYNSDQTESLILMIFDHESDIQSRNQAVWALGTLKDEQALRQLVELGQMIENNEISGISDYELNKAIQKIKGSQKKSVKLSGK